VRAVLILLGGALVLGSTGCASRGPNHVYAVTTAGGDVIDFGPARATVSEVLAADESAVGLAYDFNTDHLFVRVAPAQVIRVIERPSGKRLRDMPLPAELHTAQPADLAIRSSDRHLFALHPDGRTVVELTLFGEYVRAIPLSGLDGPSAGLAYDQQNQRLLVLIAGNRPGVGTVDATGRVTPTATFNREVRAVSLGYDSDARHFFVPLADGRSVGEFDADGKLVGAEALSGPVTALDAGPRSFVRVF
jgi:hypothetical protein